LGSNVLTLTAELVARSTGTEQVGNPRGRVQHVALTVAPGGPNRRAWIVTPAGHLHRGCHPVCGQHARRWTVLTTDPRPLCARCTAWAIRRDPSVTAQPYLQATPVQVRDALEAVTDPRELHRLVMALCSRGDLLRASVPDPVFGQRRLTAYVRMARQRISQPTARRREAPGIAFPRRVR
jgi:hypothetical protein